MTRVSREWIELGTNAALGAWPEEDCPAWQPMAEIVEAVLEGLLPRLREAVLAEAAEMLRQEQRALERRGRPPGSRTPSAWFDGLQTGYQNAISLLGGVEGTTNRRTGS